MEVRRLGVLAGQVEAQGVAQRARAHFSVGIVVGEVSGAGYIDSGEPNAWYRVHVFVI